MVKHFKKVLKPPYSAHDIPALIGVLLLFFIIPLITLNLSNTNQNLNAIELPSPCPGLGDFGNVDDSNNVINEADARKLVNGSVLSAAQKKKGDVNGDGKTDTADAAFIYRFLERVEFTFTSCADNDGDGFSNVAETYYGTDRFKACGSNAWPPDMNSDGTVSTTDLAGYVTLLGTTVTSQAQKRLDLDRDGKLTQTGDIDGVWKTYYTRKCTVVTNLTPMSLTLSANSTNVIKGDRVTLDWRTTGMNKPCFESGGWSHVVDTAGVSSVLVTDTKTFSMTCGGANGSLKKDITVNALSPCPTKIQDLGVYKGGDSKMYVVQNCQKRLIPNDEVLEYCHYKKPDFTTAQISTYLPWVTTNPEPLAVGKPCPGIQQTYFMVCGGRLSMSVSKSSGILPGEEISVVGSGLVDCTTSDSLVLQHDAGGVYRNSGPTCRITAANRTGCTITGVKFGEGTFNLRLVKDVNSDGTGEAASVATTIEVKSAPVASVFPNDPPYDKPIACDIYVSGYNYRDYLGYGLYHYAKDLGCRDLFTDGREVLSVSPGIVISSGWEGGCGNQVRVLIYANNGDKYVFRYCHLSKLKVSKNDLVSRGTVIGNVGCTGSACSGSHLHLVAQKNSVYDTGSQYGGDGNINPSEVINGVP